MIADCAVDPEVFATWRHFQSLYEDFGVSRGRLISKFPKKWVKEVSERSRELVNTGVNTEIQAARIEERLRSDRFKRKLKSPGGREYDPKETWLGNAMNAGMPFDLIVASGSGMTDNKVGAEDMLKDEPPFYRVSQCNVPRRKEELIGAAELLLKSCADVIIVDPNFRADLPRFFNTFIHLVYFLVDLGRTPRRLEVHTRRTLQHNENYVRQHQVAQWQQSVVSELPEGWNLTICYWDDLPKGGRPHARFLLTDLGGIYYDHGVDEGVDDTLVTLLEDDVWAQLFEIFRSDALPADFDPESHVISFTG